MLTVAHRAANDPEALRAVLDLGVDLAEADVRYFKGVPEVRHSKTLGSRLLWEPGELTHRAQIDVLTLADLLEVVPGARHRLMLDLKGIWPGLAPAVARTLREHAPDSPVAICTPHWWMFKAFADAPQARIIPSAGSWPMLERLRELLRKGQSGWPIQRPFFGCSVHRTLLTPAVVAELRRRVGHVLTWPVDTDAQLADARRLGVTGVTSKNLELLAQIHAPS
ncbi:glycerophosphodiester phosphodiesterase [Phytoactinopolyspora alkaliphila]|uniref:Glycerophosphodiester phosphodiesterase n=1 Tax=Phytoactinopolyspora alkaliphila TaxID=1783498 RepID=A0A6N9YJ45_9ACTN|nr:glycerophosphodiester phosphodiesterase [Phytoactinopolyspora alkaliphila]